MMRGLNQSLSRAAVLAAVAFAAVPAYGLAVAVGALSQLERGRWVVRDLDAGADRASICLGDPTALIQLEHPGGGCEQELVATDERGGTVQYSCPGRGFGRTSIRVETPRLARIDTQGLAESRPFGYRAEARRVGSC
jgi:hypothetical protein